METLDFILPRVGEFSFFFKLGNGILEFSRDLSGKGVALRRSLQTRHLLHKTREATSNQRCPQSSEPAPPRAVCGRSWWGLRPAAQEGGHCGRLRGQALARPPDLPRPDPSSPPPQKAWRALSLLSVFFSF